jgi:hypothetical protein
MCEALNSNPSTTKKKSTAHTQSGAMPNTLDNDNKWLCWWLMHLPYYKFCCVLQCVPCTCIKEEFRVKHCADLCQQPPWNISCSLCLLTALFFPVLHLISCCLGNHGPSNNSLYYTYMCHTALVCRRLCHLARVSALSDTHTTIKSPIDEFCRACCR